MDKHPSETETPGKTSRRRAVQVAAGFFISALALWLTLRSIDLSQAGQALGQANYWYLIPAVVTYLLDLATRAWRWSILLRPVRPVTGRSLFPIVLIGYMGNMLLPARMGEMLRAAMAGRRGIAVSAALGSIATERVLDGLTTVTFLLVTSRMLSFATPDRQGPPEWLATGITVVTLLFVSALAILVLMLRFRGITMTLLERVGKRLSWARRPIGWFGQFLDGLAVLRAPGLLLRAVGVGLIAWTLSMLEYYWIFRAFDLPIGVTGAYFVVAAVGLSTMIPSAPGYVGTFELASVAVLGALGVAAEIAFSAAVVVHLLQIVPVSLAGLLAAWREGFSLAGLTRQSEPAGETDGDPG